METQTHLMEQMLPEILARLPMRSIWRFKSVSKSWKSTIESAYFRHLFLSLHPNSTSTWSRWYGPKQTMEFHGSEPCDLPPSLHLGDCNYIASSGDLVLITDISGKAYCYVGKPFSHRWVKIPPPPCDSTVFGLVTSVEEYDVVLSFKVVSLVSSNDDLLSLFLYSSQTGVWTSKVLLLHCPHQITSIFHINLNNTVYFSCVGVPGVILAHDFYSESDEYQLRVVHLPEYSDDFKGILTTSQGLVMYVRALAQKEETVLKIWCLIDVDDDSWQLFWEIRLPIIIGSYSHMVVHPYDYRSLYLWSQHDHHWVFCNLETRDYTILTEKASNEGGQYCLVCDKCVDHHAWHPRTPSDLHLDFSVPVWFFPFTSRGGWNRPSSFSS